jgi:oligopeptide transport system permease protein
VLAGAMLIALVLGALAGWYGGWIDAMVSSASDIVFSIPALLGALVILSITGERTMFNVILLLTLFSWPPMVRIVRAVVQTQAQVEHAEASRAQGAANRYTLRRHVLPYSLRPLFVFGAPYTATIISAEAVLSFVGAGLQEPINSWGLMLADAQGRFTEGVEAFHLLAPAVPLTLLVWALLRVSTRLRARTPT